MQAYKLMFLLIILVVSAGCDKHDLKVDLIITNANLWSHQEIPKEHNTIVINNGLITQIGPSEVIKDLSPDVKVLNANGAFVMPGFIEGHGHFSGLGKSIQNINLLKTTDWDEVLSIVTEKIKSTPKGEWIEGRGWHQEKWLAEPEEHLHGYPLHNSLSALSQDNPLILFHASGHALFANEKAMEIAGISRETADPVGGKILRDDDGDAIGVFEERAMDLIYDSYIEYVESLPQSERDEKWLEGINLAQEACIEKGITSFQDAGSKIWEIEKYTNLAREGKLDLRLWAMVRQSSQEMEDALEKIKVLNAGEGFFTCNAIKSEIDGALGAFGAWLLKPYTDKPRFHGQNTTDIAEVKVISEQALKHDMQLCVHAIGDRANRVVVDLYEAMLPGSNPRSKRWRIEHAQHLDTTDIPRFAELGIIASMQGIHCTSDAPFVVSRLGNERAKKGAYVWRSLLDAGVLVANGTDTPVEDVDPLPSLYASVTRTRTDSGLAFFKEQSMTRHEALTSYTYSNAYAAFEEKKKGSLEVGKYADIVILNTDLIKCPDNKILDSKILYTIIDGKIKYKSSDL